VRLEVREDRDTVREVRSEEAWPLARTRWTDLYLGADGRLTDAPAAASEAAAGTGAVAFDLRSGRAAFVWDVPEDMEITGPMALRLFVELRGAEDAHLFVGVQKLRAGRVVPFEGSLGYGYDRVTNGWLKPSLRKLDPTTSTPWSPVHTYDEPQPLRPGEVVPVEIALLPSATFFRGGEQVRLLVQGRWFSARNPLFGQFPTAYERGPRGTCVLHCGGEHDARLTVPVVPPQTTP
jgi:hypothetical protein